MQQIRFKVFFISFLLPYHPSTFPLQVVQSNSIVCDELQCSNIEPLLGPDKNPDNLKNKVIMYQTSVQNRDFLKRSELSFSTKNNGGWQHIEVVSTKLKQSNGKTFHRIIGFGGAFTDTAAMLYKKLPQVLQNQIIESYYSAQGLAYSLGRVPMASTDFSCRDVNNQPALNNCNGQNSQYSYADTENDYSLDHFSLQKEDFIYKIPMIKAAFAYAPNLKLFASPWSAPAWMKDNNSMVHGGLKNDAAIKTAWANYYIRFLQQYRQNQISFWGLTVQNEPVIDGMKQWWQTMYSSSNKQAEFIQNYLGPALHNYDPNLALIIHDDQLSTIVSRSMEIIGSTQYPNARQYIDGVGVHWYENGLLPSAKYSNLTQLHDELSSINQNQFILGTEACEGYLPCWTLKCGPSLGSVGRAESYVHDIIQDLERNVSGWTDWNLLLDMKGGPSWAGNYVDAPILVDIENRKFFKQPMYYYLGHFSKFIRPEAQMLAAQSKGPFPLEQVSFVVPATETMSQYVAVIVLNRDITGRKFYIHDTEANRYINADIPAHSIQTYIYY